MSDSITVLDARKHRTTSLEDWRWITSGSNGVFQARTQVRGPKLQTAELDRLARRAGQRGFRLDQFLALSGLGDRRNQQIGFDRS